MNPSPRPSLRPTGRGRRSTNARFVVLIRKIVREVLSHPMRRGRNRKRLLSSSVQAECAQIFAVPGGGNGFARSVRAGLICARGDSLLAQFAYVPILFVGHVPEFDGVVRMEVGPAKSVWMKEPVAVDEDAAG